MRGAASSLPLLLGFVLVACNLEQPSSLDGLDAPPPPASEAFPNAPSQGGWVVTHDAEWNAMPVSNSDAEPDNGSGLGIWGDRSTVSILDVPDAPWGAGGRAITFRLPAGAPGGHSPAWVGPHRGLSGGDSPLSFPTSLSDGGTYVGLWIRHRGSSGRAYTPLGAYPDGQIYNANVAQKWVYLKSQGVPDDRSFAHYLLGFNDVGRPGAEANRLFPVWGTQFPTGSSCPSESYWPALADASGMNDDGWHRVEFLLLPNTFRSDRTPNPDGVAKVWLDGRLIVDRDDAINYCERQAGADGSVEWPISLASLEPIYGGGTWPVPYDLYVDYGRMRFMYHRR